MRHRIALGALVALAALLFSSTAWAHARVSPPTALANQLQWFTLAVPTEKDGATTTTIQLTPPAGFGIDSFAPAPGWKRTVAQTGSGEDATVTKVTWTGGSVPTGEDSVFGFLASTSGSGNYTFDVKQTYSDGSIVDWNGSESSDSPAPVVKAVSSFGGGTPLITWIALVLGIAGVVLGGVALLARSGRQLT
jgi:uncharacterized protein YcnI